MIDDFVAAFALTLARVGTFIHILPLLGGANMPRTVKIGLALALAMVFFTEASGSLAQAGGCSALGLGSWVGFGLAVGREMILGGVLGFAMGLFLLPAHVAAEFITQEGGLSFANVLTASGDGSTNALTVVFEMLASVVFLGLDLHHGFLLLLQETFRVMPIGQGFPLPNWDPVMAVSAAEEGGLLLVAPIALCLFLTTVVLALMTRAAPQLNLYSVGFPVRVFVFLGSTLIMLPQVLAGMLGLFSYFLGLLRLQARREEETLADDIDLQQKTEPPSPRRREQAAEEGQFPLSAELNTGVLLFVGAAGLMWLAHSLGGGLLTQTRLDLALLPQSDLTTSGVQNIFVAKFGQGLSIAGIMIGLLFFTTLALGVAQVGFNLNFGRLAINWERVFPFKFERLLGWDKLMSGLFLICKILAIGVVAWWIVRQHGQEITHLGDASLAGAMANAWRLTIRITLGLASTLLVIGVSDYAYQRWRFERSLYMTKQEVKEEHKRDEGNPQTKARIRKLQRDNAQRKMFHNVPKATVVVTNPTHYAVALQYESGMAAPKVVAKGADHIAQRIKDIARRHGVPVVERRSLAQMLYKTVKVDQSIPLGLYVVIAELMAYVYRLKGDAGMDQGRKTP